MCPEPLRQAKLTIWIKAIIGTDEEITISGFNKTKKYIKNISIANNKIIQEPIVQKIESDINEQSIGTVVIDSQKSNNPINFLTGAFIGTNGNVNFFVRFKKSI
mgnify:CR=1 FL=1